MINKKHTLYKGLRLRCPKCGEGKLFRRYIVQNAHCSHCHEPIGDIRADDAPAWLTILITGHLIVPFLITSETKQWLPYHMEITLAIAAALLCTALILPRAKGLFIAGIWMTQRK